MAHDASVLYARSIETLLMEAIEDGRVHIDLDDEVLAGAVVTHGGRIVHPRLSDTNEEAAN